MNHLIPIWSSELLYIFRRIPVLEAFQIKSHLVHRVGAVKFLLNAFFEPLVS
jgi:hypothetical protein